MSAAKHTETVLESDAASRAEPAIGGESAGQTGATANGPYALGGIIADKYQLVRKLGEGGMGAVWVAKNLALDAHVAIKLIHSSLSASTPGVGNRLLQEARAAAAIGHPAIIQVFDFGLTQQGDPFLAMELLHGESLAQLIKRRNKLTPTRAVQSLLPIADALFAAHASGIVHRDLKPDNIFLARYGVSRIQPKVLDFGIAKLEQKVSPSITREGTVLGSPAYMSPEQARGESDVDLRSDIWSLCVVLYELVSGQWPFSAENHNALMWSILHDTPPAITELDVAEPELWAIIERGLTKDRAARFQSMLDLGQALALWLLDRGIDEDVCHAPLKSTWFERAAASLTGMPPEFFPSEAPKAIAVDGSKSSEATLEELESGIRSTSSSLPHQPNVGSAASKSSAAATQAANRSHLPRAKSRRPAIVAGIAALTLALGYFALRLTAGTEAASKTATQPPSPTEPAAPPSQTNEESTPSPAKASEKTAPATSTEPADAPKSAAAEAPSAQAPQKRSQPNRAVRPVKRRASELKNPFR